MQDKIKTVRMPPIQGFPFYSDWLKVLLARGAAFEMVDEANEIIIKPLDRHQEQRTLVNDNGETGTICIGCGQPMYGEMHQSFKTSGKMVRKKFDKIKIGGFIQVQEEERTSPNEITIFWKVRPVTKEGTGCKSCWRAFEAEVKRTNELNMLRESYANILAMMAQEARDQNAVKELEKPPVEKKEHVRCMHGIPDQDFCAVCLRDKGLLYRAEGIKLPGKVTAFLDVFPRKAPPESE